MNGKWIVGGIVVVAVIAGAGLWYSRNYAYYETVEGITEITAYGDVFAVTNYRGIDASTSPLKMRACFQVDWDYWPSDEFKAIAEPLVAPSWFDCFDARAMARDVQADSAVAIRAAENEPYGFNRFIVQYPDGRAFMWRQINACGEAQFSGEDLPRGCPDPVTEAAAAGDLTVPAPSVSDPDLVIYQPDAPLDEGLRLTPIGGGAAEEILAEDTVFLVSKPGVVSICFTSQLSFGLLSETYKTADDARPPVGVQGACFDGVKLADKLTRGIAMAIVGQRNISPGADRIVAFTEDGRGYAWDQKRGIGD